MYISVFIVPDRAVLEDCSTQVLQTLELSILRETVEHGK